MLVGLGEAGAGPLVGPGPAGRKRRGELTSLAGEGTGPASENEAERIRGDPGRTPLWTPAELVGRVTRQGRWSVGA